MSESTPGSKAVTLALAIFCGCSGSGGTDDRGAPVDADAGFDADDGATTAPDSGPLQDAEIHEAGGVPVDFRPAPGYAPSAEPARPALRVVPEVLVLSPDETAELAVTSSDGTPIIGPEVTGPAGLAKIAGLVVTADFPGSGTLVVTKEGFAPAFVDLFVSFDAPEGAASIRFEPPSLQLVVGETVELRFTVLDGRGLVTDEPATLVVSGPSATLVGNQLRAIAPGAAVLSATTMSGQPLGGRAFVAVSAPLAANCATNVRELLGCSVARAPRVFARPGLSSPVRVHALYQRTPSTCDGRSTLEVDDVAPDEILLPPSAPVRGSAGALESVEAGAARAFLRHEGLLCDSVQIIVLYDVQGPWAYTCENGDAGLLDVTASHPGRNSISAIARSSPWDGAGSPTTAIFAEAKGDSCTTSAAESCSDQRAVLRYFTSGTFSVEECASTQHPTPIQSRILTADSFQYGSCTFSRSTARCNELEVTVDGRSITTRVRCKKRDDRLEVYNPFVSEDDIGDSLGVSLTVVKFRGAGTYSNPSFFTIDEAVVGAYLAPQYPSRRETMEAVCGYADATIATFEAISNGGAPRWRGSFTTQFFEQGSCFDPEVVPYAIGSGRFVCDEVP